MTTKTQELMLEKLNEVIAENPSLGSIDIRDLIDGDIEVKNGKLQIELSLPADLLLPTRDVRNVLAGNWKAIPVLLILHEDDVRDKDGNVIDA